MKEKNKTYTAADFARYHAGTMPANEMHALEKAALEDPFIEHALEGYTHATDFESDIKELNGRLTEKRKKKNIFFISSFAENKWWRIAALFIIIAGTAYLFFQVNNNSSKNNSLATNEIKAPPKKIDSTPGIKSILKPLGAPVPMNDSSFENQQAFTAETKKKSNLTRISSSLQKGYSNSSQIEKSTASASLHNPNARTRSDSTYLDQSITKNDEPASGENLLKGKVTDHKNSATSFPGIIDRNRNIVTYTDTANRILLQPPDSSITATAMEPASKNVNLKKDVPPAVATNKTGEELNEVVVVGYGGKKKGAHLSKVLKGKTAGVQVTTGQAQPTGGQEKFDQYLKDNTTPVYDSNGMRLTGEVSLSFFISKKGNPKNIKVTKSSCSVCETEAIRLLENGPRWVGKKKQEGNAVIKF